MKKILGFSSLVALLVLTACGGGSSASETVCTADLLGLDATFTATVEDDQVTYVEIQIDISDLDDEEAEMMATMLDGTISGNYVNTSEEEDMPLADFIEEIESLEGSCD